MLLDDAASEWAKDADADPESDVTSEFREREVGCLCSASDRLGLRLDDGSDRGEAGFLSLQRLDAVPGDGLQGDFLFWDTGDLSSESDAKLPTVEGDTATGVDLGSFVWLGADITRPCVMVCRELITG